MHFTIQILRFVFNTYLAKNTMADKMRRNLSHACTNGTNVSAYANELNP